MGIFTWRSRQKTQRPRGGQTVLKAPCSVPLPTTEPRTSCKMHNRLCPCSGNCPEGLSVSAASSGAARFGNSGTGGKLAGGQSVRQPLPCSRECPSVSSGRTCGNSSVHQEAPWVVSLSTVPGTLPELKKRSVREGTKDRRIEGRRRGLPALVSPGASRASALRRQK